MYSNFIDYIKRYKNEKEIKLFWDIETFQYNEDEGNKKPSMFKNCAFSWAVSWYEKDVLDEVIFPNLKTLMETITEACKTKKNGEPSAKASFNLIAHNNNKYDNHYLLKDLLFYYPSFQRKNIFLANAVNNDLTVKKSELKKKSDKQFLILEKRVKSSNNLVLDIYFKGLHFFTTDNWVKTNLPLRVLGKKLFRKGLIKESELKTDFDYLKHNLDYDLTEEQAHLYADEIFNSLTEDELTYIRNDVIVLAKSVRYYDTIFPNFDYKKMTFTSNILEFYKTNELTTFQLLNYIGEGKDKLKINYTDYRFCNENLYDFIKSFYRGGLNFYNQHYISKIVEKAFSIDINSSYPYVMFNFKIPTFLSSFNEYEIEETINVNYNDDYYYMYRMDKQTFNNDILMNIESKIFKQMLVKYYSVNDFVNINTYTLRMISEIVGIPIMKLKVLAVLKYECVDFGAKDKIFENYRIKTQGKLKNKIYMESPMIYEILDDVNNEQLSEEEIANAKVLLNGLYGIPALKAYFHLFRILPNDELESIPNGYKNNERNLVFSVFVTSVALYNLLSPLAYLTQNEIDDYFIYCDTDSLYLKKEAYDKLPKDIYDPISLGKWDIEHENISKMYVLNHKKYCLFDDDKKEIIVKCGGIDLNSFDTNMSFEDFIDTQFHHGAHIKNTKSIYTAYGTIAIYQSTTKIEQGKEYPYFFSKVLDNLRKDLLQMIKEDHEKEGFENDVLYIESELGTFGQSEIYQIKNPIKNKNNLIILKSLNQKIKSLL